MSEKIFKIAVIGCSGMAKRHMEGIKLAEGAELYAICDTAPERLAAAKEELGCERTVTDYMDIVNDPEVDAAVVVTPDQIHCEMVCNLLRAGKAVMCEKPMALTMEECEEMMRVERETNGKLMVGQICRFTPGFEMAKKLVDEGRIGDLTFVESEYAHNYTNARGYGDWRVTPERPGFLGGGCHAVDLLRWIAGDPREITAYSNRKTMLDWPTDDNTIAIMRFDDNVIGKVFVSTGCKRNYTMRSVFYGTKGTIICDNKSATIQLFEDNAELGLTYHDAPQEIPVEVNNHNATAEIKTFVDALVKGEAMPIPSYEGANTVAVCCAALESAKTGRPVEVKYPTV